MRRLSADRGASLPGIILVVVGALLIAAAGILKWVIVPSQLKLPDNNSKNPLNVNLAIDGTYSGINNAALAKGDIAHIKLTNAPISFNWSVKTIQTKDDSMLVTDTRVIILKSDGSHLADQAFAYSINEKTVKGSSTFTGNQLVPFPAPFQNTPAQTVPIVNPGDGITINFPFTAPKSTVNGYNVYNEQVAPLNYTNSDSTAASQWTGLTTQNYVDAVNPTPIKAATALAPKGEDGKALPGGLPASFPKAVISAVVPLLGLPADVQDSLKAALPTLPDPVPLSYLYQDRTTFNAEPVSGAVLGIDQDQTWSMQVKPANAAPISIPVLNLHIVPTQSAADIQANMARWTKTTSGSGMNNITKYNLMSMWIPLGLVVVGALLLLGGILLIVRRRPQAAEAAGAMDRPHVPATGRARPARDQATTQHPVEVRKDDTTRS